jgi:KUP system potassium uptake protein
VRQIVILPAEVREWHAGVLLVERHDTPRGQEVAVQEATIAVARPGAPHGAVSALTLSALGIVFGDIGTSPLYTLKTVLDSAGAQPSRAAILGSLSLIVWTLIIVTSVKYVTLAMRIDNEGEGGILALMALLGIKRQHRPLIVLIGLFGAALIYGDGAITPAISVLSALEGLDIMVPAFQRFVVPAAVAILVALFLAQRQGTARIGRLFGPVMTLWFVTIAVLGLYGLSLHPSVLAAINPRYGLAYLASGGRTAFTVLGGVFLCVTGAEALYADMGHFGPRPIRLAWSWLVLPSLLLSYAGQSALVLSGAPTSDNIFYRLCPPLLLPLLVLLATIATIIASQSIITGAFSMTRQAIQLGWMPRLRITQTSAQGYGQIYVGAVNWLLMLATLGLTVGFGKSDNLAAAYGIAVAMTMLMTTGLLFVAMRDVWQWGLLPASLVAGALFIVDIAFVAANLLKFLDGGYVPLLLAAAVFGVMMIWHQGMRAMVACVRDSVMPIDTVMEQIARGHIPRVPGTAVFLTRTEHDAPPVLVWHLRHSRALQEKLFILTVVTELVPWVADAGRLEVAQIAPGIWRGRARYGFMERPNAPTLMRRAQAMDCAIDLDDLTYFVGHETVARRADKAGLPAWIANPFAYLQRNAAHFTDYLQLPADRVMEIGREIEI